MKSNINIIAFGTFGSPNGYTQTIYDLKNNGNGNAIKNLKTFDLNSNAIKLLPNSKLYAIRREVIDGNNSISYSIYSFAKEQNSERGGTFIGSSILYCNSIADESLTISMLNEFNAHLLDNNVQNDRIIVEHSDKLNVIKPSDFDKVSYSLKNIPDINFTESKKGNLVVYTGIKFDNLISLYTKSIDLLGNYETIFFTDNNEIAEFVYQKGLYKLVKNDGFEQEISTVIKDREQKVTNSISEFEIEKQKLQSDKESVISELKSQIERNKSTHYENERILSESESNINKISSYYSEFSNKLNDYANQLRSGKTLEEVRKIYNENKRIFIDSVANLKQPQYLKNLNKIKATSNLQQDYRQQQNQSFNQTNNYSNEEAVPRNRKFNVYKIFTFLFAILWLLSMVYFLWFEKQKNAGYESSNVQTPIIKDSLPPPEQIKLPELIPVPTSKLNENDLRLVNKVGIKNKTSKEIVEIIFKKNPSEIANYYNTQKDVYAKVLISQNSNCFKDSLCICDSLTTIPSNK